MRETVLTLFAAMALLSATVGCASKPDATPAPQVPERGVGPIVSRAEAAMAAEDHDRAIAAYQEALERTPWNERLKKALVTAYIARAAKKRSNRQGRGLEATQDAEADLREALEVFPDDPDLKDSLAAMLLERAALESDDAVSEKLRAEAAELSPELVAATPVVRVGVERRLDMAYDLIERGQLGAGIDSLERLHQGRPDDPGVAKLLAQALVRKGLELHDLRDHAGAGQVFGRAVELYAELAPCDGSRCTAAELRTAHQNRIVAWLSAEDAVEAQAAIEGAAEHGLEFPELTGILEDLR